MHSLLTAGPVFALRSAWFPLQGILFLTLLKLFKE